MDSSESFQRILEHAGNGGSGLDLNTQHDVVNNTQCLKSPLMQIGQRIRMFSQMGAGVTGSLIAQALIQCYGGQNE